MPLELRNKYTFCVEKNIIIVIIYRSYYYNVINNIRTFFPVRIHLF